MDKFTIFREMLDYFAHIGDVTDAQMSNYAGDMVIACEAGGKIIRLTVEFEEVQQDA